MRARLPRLTLFLANSCIAIDIGYLWQIVLDVGKEEETEVHPRMASVVADSGQALGHP